MNNRRLLGLLLVLVSSALTAQSALQTADSLIAKQAYESAFRSLGAANDDPLIVVMKTEICLNYFVQSLNHQAFAFKDFSAGDTFDQLRSGQGTYRLQPFDPAEALGRLIAAGKSDPVLFKALGDYYYDVSLRYRGRWTASDQEIAQKAVENYEKAYSAGLRDTTLLTNYADKAIELGRFSRAIELYKLALVRDPSLPHADFNLAYASLQFENFVDALLYGEQAIAKYRSEPNYRMDTLLLCFDAAYRSEDYRRALGYLESALEISEEEYRVFQRLAYVHLAQGNLTAADESVDRLFALDPTNPGATQLVTSTFDAFGKRERIAAFFARNLPQYQGEPEAQANLYFHQALDFEGVGDKAQALNAAALSQSRFLEAGAYSDAVRNAVEALVKRNS